MTDLSDSISAQTLEGLIRDRLQATHVQVADLSGGCGTAFEVVIVSAAFEKKLVLARHRLVNTALKDEIAQIHAFTQKCYTPAEYAKQVTL